MCVYSFAREGRLGDSQEDYLRRKLHLSAEKPRCVSYPLESITKS